MCRSIKRLYFKDIPPTDEEVSAAARQFVRKVSGMREPSMKNKKAFDRGVKGVSRCIQELLTTLHQVS